MMMPDSPPTGRQPAYVQIASALQQEIREGALEAHKPIPSERTLCEKYGVSRMTARQAVGILQQEGAVYKDGRRGTFVAEERIPIRIGSFSREIALTGHRPSAEVVWVKDMSVPPPVAAALDLEPREPVRAIQRLRRSNGDTVALETSYYPQRVLPGFPGEDLTGSLWEVLERDFGVRVERTEARVEVVVLGPQSSAHLEVRPAGSGMKLTRKSYDQRGRCVEYAEDLYRADKVVLQIERFM